MGTRADFYVGRGEEAEWLGSIALDGYPTAIPSGVVAANSEQRFRQEVTILLLGRDDATVPAQGWPWPWEDSRTTDYAYAFDGGRVLASSFGHEWFPADSDEPDRDDDVGEVAVFPPMSARKNVTLGKRSGLIIVGRGGSS